MFEQVVLDHVSVLFVEFVGVIVVAEFQAGGIGDGSHLVEVFAGSFQIGFRLSEIDARQYDVLAARRQPARRQACFHQSSHPASYPRPRCAPVTRMPTSSAILRNSAACGRRIYRLRMKRFRRSNNPCPIFFSTIRRRLCPYRLRSNRAGARSFFSSRRRFRFGRPTRSLRKTGNRRPWLRRSATLIS